MTKVINRARENDAKPLNRKILAIGYAKLGLSVVPMRTIIDGKCDCYLGVSCKNPGKHPSSQHGVADASSKPNRVKRLWRDCRSANIGIATGKVSSILVLDIDARNGGFETLAKLQAKLGELPPTVTSKTGGGGKHFIFKYPSGSRIHKDSAGKLLGAGIDILSNGAIMVAPPSLHSSGKLYEWAEGLSFDDIEPAEFPARWLAKLTVKKSRAMTKSKRTFSVGSRNTGLTRLAGKLRREGLSGENLSSTLQAENLANCSPPLEEEEVERIANSVGSYPANHGERDDAEVMMQRVLAQHFNDGRHLSFQVDGSFWHYTGKVWVPVSVPWVNGRILETIKASPRTKQQTTSLMNQVRTLLQATLAANADPLEFVNEPPCVINCANGELWIAKDGSLDLHPHRPESKLRDFVDITYDAKAKCPEYNKALLEIFGKTTDPKKMDLFWNELVGYLIQPLRAHPIVPILLGRGSNGKTVLAGTLVALLGPNQVTARPVEDLAARFSMGSLLGKRLYLDDDVRAGARLPDGILKTISEAKIVTGENKYGPQFNFVVRATPMLLCNNVPSLADLSFGMLRRLMVIPFARQFSEDEKDLELLKRIRKNELPGVLNRALRGYRRLAKRGKFKPPKAVRRATRAWLTQASPVSAFLKQCCVTDASAKCLMQELYPAYQEWAKKSGFTITQNQLAFRRNLEHLGYKAHHGSKGQMIRGLKLH